MSKTPDSMFPGEHPHSDRPNWRPAETPAGYLANCREGLEQYSEKRMAHLMGVARVELWRAELMADIPDDLFDALLATARQRKGRRLTSAKELANIGRALSGHGQAADVERCPHCGEVLRIRRRIAADMAETVDAWLAERQGEASQ